MKIVVLDSGLNINSSLAKEMNFNGGVEIYEEEGKVKIRYDAIDDLGHGTSVASYIKKLYSECEIIPVKIISNNMLANTNVMCMALEYIYRNISCDIINISAGVVSCDEKNRLHNICKLLVKRNTIIVAAYDNGGAVSFPATFDCVIGVDGVREKWATNQFKKVQHNISDYVFALKETRLPSLDDQIEICSGNSFIAPIVTAKVARLISMGHNTFEQVVAQLDSEASALYSNRKYINRQIPFKINRAIVFPYNKEMRVIAHNEDLLGFIIHNYFDLKYSGNVGKIKLGSENNANTKIIRDFDALDWSENFDTVILGHTSIMSNALGRNIEFEIINMCKKYGKQLFSCHDIRFYNDSLNGLKYYCPYVDINPKPEFIKMHVAGAPVLGIVGTGGNQGKFTIQLGLRRELLSRGYNLAQLGTEPTAQLFGMDCVYPMGHESSVYPKGFDAVLELNHMMSYMDNKNPDIIMFGNQANTVPFHVGGPQDYPVVQHELILGCQADAYILCVSEDATMQYIKRIISYLEGVYNSKVIAVVLSTLSTKYRWSTVSSGYSEMSPCIKDKFMIDLAQNFNLPIFALNDENLYYDLTDLIIEFFS